MRMPSVRSLALLAVVALGAVQALAQAPYPNHTIKILVGIPPGGAPDVVARLVGHYLSESLGQPVVIENRTGANGNIASEAVATAPPDGYTLLLGADSAIVINPHIYSTLKIDPLKDLLPITSVATNQFVLAVNPKLPVKTLPELVDYAKKAKPPLAFASGGPGSQHSMAMAVLRQRAGFELLEVTYRGGSPSMQATIAGETQVLFAGGESAGQFEAGTLRPLAMSGKARSKRYPDLPTIGEFYPGYAVDIWLGLFAPAGTPEPIVTKLREAVQTSLAKPEVAAKVNVSGSLEPLIMKPAEFSDLIRKDDEKFGKLIKELKIKVN
jgi:tripartite-type tricarboxylate transporter receptor subunit TctC